MGARISAGKWAIWERESPIELHYTIWPTLRQNARYNPRPHRAALSSVSIARSRTPTYAAKMQQIRDYCVAWSATSVRRYQFDNLCLVRNTRVWTACRDRFAVVSELLITSPRSSQLRQYATGISDYIIIFLFKSVSHFDTRHSYSCMKVLPPSLIEWLRLVRRHRVVVVLQSMEVGQLGRIGKTVTLHAATAGWFESVTATILRRHTTVKIVEKITVNIERAPSCAVVGLQNFCYIAKLTTYVFSGAECFSK